MGVNAHLEALMVHRGRALHPDTAVRADALVHIAALVAPDEARTMLAQALEKDDNIRWERSARERLQARVRALDEGLVGESARGGRTATSMGAAALAAGFKPETRTGPEAVRTRAGEERER